MAGVVERLTQSRTGGLVLKRVRKNGRWEIYRGDRLMMVGTWDIPFADMIKWKLILEGTFNERDTPERFSGKGRIDWENVQDWPICLDTSRRGAWEPLLDRGLLDPWHGLGNSGTGWLSEANKKFKGDRDYDADEDLS